MGTLGTRTIDHVSCAKFFTKE